MQGLHDFKIFVNPFSHTRRNLVVWLRNNIKLI
jgi:hypothetical protein